MKRWQFLLMSALLSGCAAYSGRGLQPGVATLDTVIQTMGEPAMRWQGPDGALQLAYPRGPASPQSFMVHLDKDGKLLSIRNVLVPEVTGQITPGMTQAQVLRLIGPPIAARTIYFAARDELVWDWRYEDKTGDLSHFSVLFDATLGTVRSTLVVPDVKVGVPF